MASGTNGMATLEVAVAYVSSSDKKVFQSDAKGKPYPHRFLSDDYTDVFVPLGSALTTSEVNGKERRIHSPCCRAVNVLSEWLVARENRGRFVQQRSAPSRSHTLEKRLRARRYPRSILLAVLVLGLAIGSSRMR